MGAQLKGTELQSLKVSQSQELNQDPQGRLVLLHGIVRIN